MSYTQDSIIEEVDLTLLAKTKKYCRRKIPDNKRCLGRKIDRLRCTRSKILNYDFCRSHLKSLPNGRVDDGKTINKKPLKCGRKKKYEKNVNDYICVYKKKINNRIYLLDEENYVYKNNLVSPDRIGKYNNADNKINYFTKNDIIVVN